MNYRVTSFAIGSRAIQFSAKHNAAVLKYQEQISSGLKLQKPSDDPIAFREVTALNSRITELQADQQSLSRAKSILNSSVVQVQEFGNIFSRAKVLAQQGVQALDQSERDALAVEVDGLLTQLIEISKSTFDGAYIFGGTKSNRQPFEFVEPKSGLGTLSVTYHGSNQNSRAYVGESVAIDTFYAGSEIFYLSNRSKTIIHGDTGVKSGPGVDTLTGRAPLQVTHDATTYLGASGLQPGVDSVNLDTIIGDIGVHQISINDTSGDGSFGTISLNSGVEVAYTNADTNLELTGTTGERVFVDTTSISAGFSGTIDVSATGNLSVDGGQSLTTIDFSTSQIVSDSETGKFAVFNTTDVTKVGSNSLEFPGTSNAFQVLFDLATDLRNGQGLDSGDLSASLDRRLAEVEAMSDHAFETLGEQSTSLATLERLTFRLEDLELSAESQLSEVQSTNIPEAVLRLENSQSLLQYTYAVTAQISSLGLLDFLR